MDQAKSERAEGETQQEQSTAETFTLNVEIEGLPYVFRGKIPETLEVFEFTIHILDWKEELKKIKEKIAQGKLSYMLELSSFEQDEGEIAYIRATPSKAADLYIERVRSNTWLLKETPYQDAGGLGRFLMNNLLTLADVKGWSVTAFPYTDGRLSDQDILEWLRRKGFDWAKGELVRQPRQPDTSQPIAKLLEKWS